MEQSDNFTGENDVLFDSSVFMGDIQKYDCLYYKLPNDYKNKCIRMNCYPYELLSVWTVIRMNCYPYELL